LAFQPCTRHWSSWDTVEKKSLHPQQKESERVQLARQEHWRQVEQHELTRLFFLDEMGVNLAMARTHARIKGGGRAYDAVAPAGKNVSVVSAIGLEGVVAYQAIYGSLDSLGFESFLATALLPQLRRGDCLVLDNCSIHKTVAIRELCHEAGIELLFLPPYSPDFNPIENMWSKLKAGLRALKAQTYAALVEALKQVFATVSESDILHWFTHSCYCYS
jgi:transposase